MRLRPNWMLGGLACLLVSCGPQLEDPKAADSTATVSMASAANPEESASGPTQAAAPATPKPASSDHFRQAVNAATSAVSIGQSAQSPQDWDLAINRWQVAIDFMAQVPAGDPNYSKAQQKIAEYRQNLAAARQQRQAIGTEPTVSSSEPVAADGRVAQIPIVARRGGIPVVPVSLQGQQGQRQFTMLFDTGASGTLITRQMADAIGVTIVGEATVTIADGSRVTLPLGYVNAIDVGGLRQEGVVVAIGGDVGLLGQDIYGDYGISMGSHAIHLYP
ncbi:hypothetical protein XM38_027420 [Halomicronema hongdechloris C2206]|uniref:Peptidase A2 domain-containing protein n=1 Tax=Halomicronema hongdechloris C2206 TaxID=1641165 RepID=A0A1Z3HNA2_9CYAN|nr:retropepsin-like aspartic protease [Halomicronema hongdechloris]ASC71788.1 hypothetical protein XM38_027420 [Halomicronema hongdechloris C2206]